jgi:hypothetical protein
MQELWSLEQAGWEALCGAEPRTFYDQLLADDAITIVPGAILDRGAVLGSWDDVPPWQTYEFAEQSTMHLATDTVALIYQATTRRADQRVPYRATITSVYTRRGGAWRLVLHQQTPQP